MKIEVCRAKISHLHVTDSELDYTEGSLTVDGALLEEAGLVPYEKVLVIDLNNAQRFETYLIEGEHGSGKVCLNGGTARLGEVGDQLIVLSFAQCTPEEARGFTPTVIFADEQNRIEEIHS